MCVAVAGKATTGSGSVLRASMLLALTALDLTRRALTKRAMVGIAGTLVHDQVLVCCVRQHLSSITLQNRCRISLQVFCQTYGLCCAVV
jgi:hypothetical protein